MAANKALARLPWGDLAASVARVSRKSEDAELHYFLSSDVAGGWSIVIGKRKQGAELGPLTPVREPTATLSSLEVDRDLVRLLPGLRGRNFYGDSRHRISITDAELQALFARLVATGRCHLVPREPTGAAAKAWQLFTFAIGPTAHAVKSQGASYAPLLDLPVLRRSQGEPWALEFALVDAETRAPSGTRGPIEYEAHATLVRGKERRAPTDIVFMHDDGSLLFADGSVGVGHPSDARWLGSLRALAHAGCVLVPESELDAFLELTAGENGVSQLTLPAGFERVSDTGAPCPVLELDAPRGRAVRGRVFFEYSGQRVPLSQRSALIILAKRRVLERDRAAEDAARAQLSAAGFEGTALGRRSAGSGDVTIADLQVLPAISALLEAGWQVFAEGKRYRSLKRIDIRVESGLDWFEVQGKAHFDQTEVALPRLLRLARNNSATVELGDGSRGILPADWLARWGGFAEVAPEQNGRLRFSSRQLGIAEAALFALGEELAVPGLEELRQRVTEFYDVKPVQPPPGFLGELRPYQAHGLSWLTTLSKLKLGACLADDMGLGKTIQVLAHLANVHRHSGKRSERRRSPSLVVVPRSLLENWRAEAARFAPKLRFHTHWGPDRGEVTKSFAGVDVVLTTYSTLRLDIQEISRLELATVVLDEAQAIKNDASATAKCVRRLRAEHRIALSGTPIENHLGELWSLFEFLNPGLLAELPQLQRALHKDQASPETLKLIQRVLQPFMLRRTKQEVAKDLPERSEQTLFVDLEEDERTHYDELLRYYQASIKKRGFTTAGRGTPYVLEAILRLRQAACHPGLVDKARSHERSTKIELLVRQLRGLAREGHKALVFSQFTSLLAILRERLDQERIAFEYLDGKTPDRAACVERFQTDPNLPVFLVSLKAGGVGLNLTAADYVFILDPWWNPAAEAQAIDRAHRIGQTRKVIAYRLLARNTIEERVAQLQQRKRELVAAIMGDEGAFAGRLTREDLEGLLETSAA